MCVCVCCFDSVPWAFSVMIGQRDGKRVYRMAQVADFVPYNRTYRFDRAFVDVRLPRTGGGGGV